MSQAYISTVSAFPPLPLALVSGACALKVVLPGCPAGLVEVDLKTAALAAQRARDRHSWKRYSPVPAGIHQGDMHAAGWSGGGLTRWSPSSLGSSLLDHTPARKDQQLSKGCLSAPACKGNNHQELPPDKIVISGLHYSQATSPSFLAPPLQCFLQT